MLINHDGATRLYVFTDFTTGGDCTARTKSGRRCRNIVWDQGQVAMYTTTYAGDLVVTCYGPLPDQVRRQYLDQRCRVHDNVEADAFCDPEWEMFDPQRHRSMGSTPRYSLLFGSDRMIPPARTVVLALREYCTPAERRILAELLTADE